MREGLLFGGWYNGRCFLRGKGRLCCYLERRWRYIFFEQEVLERREECGGVF